MSPLVSVIIPVYNVEKYIKKCMQSLLDQNYKNFEAIIVDDGSLDNSIAVAQSLTNSDSRFIFLEKENGGQGSARNLALDHVKGEYVAFLDSDDYYDNEYLSIMIKSITTNDADICMCSTKFVDNDENVINVHQNNLSEYYSKQDYLLSYRTISNYMCDKVFKVSCFNNFRFDPSIRTFEDVHLLFRILYQRTMVSIDVPLYNYVQRSGSTMRSYPKSYIKDRYSIYLTVKDFYEKNLSNDSKYKTHLHHHFLNNFIFDSSIKIVRHSKEYSDDITKLLSNDDKIFTFTNIIKNKTLPRNNRIALLLLKSNHQAFKLFMSKWLIIKQDVKK